MSKKYTGLLHEPIASMRRPSLAEDSETVLAEELDRLKATRAIKLALLMEEHGVSPDAHDWQQRLLWALIDAHVPGLSDPHATPRRTPVGKPQRRTVSHNLQLIADVARLRLDGDRSIKSACTELCRSVAYSDEKATSLQNRFNEARRMPLAKMLEAAGLTLDRPDLWEQFAEAYSGTSEIEALNNPSNRKI